MEPLPKVVQRHLQGTQKPGVHPDADLLAAFAEKSLNDGERSHVLQHLAECADCREVISLAAPEIEPAQSPRPEGLPRISWPVLRWGALAACVLVVGAAVTLHYESPVHPSLEERASAPPSAGLPLSNGPEPPAEKLAAKTAPPSPFQSDRDFRTAAGKLSKQREKETDAGTSATRAGMSAPQKLDRDQNVREFTNGRLADALAAKSADKPAFPASSAPSPAPLPATKVGGAESQAETRSDAADHAVGAMNETVMVEGAVNSVQVLPPIAEKKTKDQPSKNESQKEVQNAPAGVAGAMAGGDRKADILAAETAQTVSVDHAKRLRAGHDTPRWTLSAEGGLQRSFDSGKNWQTVPVASNTVFRALAANDSDVWVGGTAGALYHSSDAGRHWTQVYPVADGKALTAEIVSVEFSDAQHGKLTTSNHETWTSSDAGNTWQSH